VIVFDWVIHCNRQKFSLLLISLCVYNVECQLFNCLLNPNPTVFNANVGPLNNGGIFNPNCNNNNRLTQAQCNQLLLTAGTGKFNPAAFGAATGTNLATVNNLDLANCLQGIPINPNNNILTNAAIANILPQTAVAAGTGFQNFLPPGVTLPNIPGFNVIRAGNPFGGFGGFGGFGNPFRFFSSQITINGEQSQTFTHYNHLFESDGYVALLVSLAVAFGLMMGTSSLLCYKQYKDNKQSQSIKGMLRVN